MPLQRNDAKRLIKAALKTRSEEIGCDACLSQLHQFVELKLVGKKIPEALMLIEEHLEMCGECCEEYEALEAALKDVASSARHSRESGNPESL